MKGIMKYLHRCRVRRLAERILSNQMAYGYYDNRVESVRNAIATAEQFYHEWETIITSTSERQ